MKREHSSHLSDSSDDDDVEGYTSQCGYGGMLHHSGGRDPRTDRKKRRGVSDSSEISSFMKLVKLYCMLIVTFY